LLTGKSKTWSGCKNVAFSVSEFDLCHFGIDDNDDAEMGSPKATL
jgi:hypothetical protein